MLTFSVYAVAENEVSQEQPEAVKIEAKKKAENAGNSEEKGSEKVTETAPAQAETAIIINTLKTTNPDKQISQEYTQESAEQVPDSWVVFGYRVKVTDSLIVIFTGLLFLSTSGLFLVTWMTAKATEQAAFTADETALASGMAAHAAEKAASIATSAERARIWINEITLSNISDRAEILYPTKITPFQLSFKIENWGRSPGFNIICIINLTVVGDESFSDIAKNDFVVPTKLGDLKSQQIDFVINNPIPPHVMEPGGKKINILTDTWNDIKSFNKYLFLHGHVTYDDIFGVTHKSAFGYRYIYPPSGTTGNPELYPLSHPDYWKYT